MVAPARETPPLELEVVWEQQSGAPETCEMNDVFLPSECLSLRVRVTSSCVRFGAGEDDEIPASAL